MRLARRRVVMRSEDFNLPGEWDRRESKSSRIKRAHTATKGALQSHRHDFTTQT